MAERQTDIQEYLESGLPNHAGSLLQSNRARRGLTAEQLAAEWPGMEWGDVLTLEGKAVLDASAVSLYLHALDRAEAARA